MFLVVVVIIDVACDVFLLFGVGRRETLRVGEQKNIEFLFCVWNIFRYE